MLRLVFASVLLAGCAGSSATPPDDPACAPQLFEPSGNDHLVSVSNYVGFAGDWRPEVVIHGDGHVTSAFFDGSERETATLGEARVAELVEELRESGAVGEAEGCYGDGGALPTGPDAGCGIKVTLQLDGTTARFSGCDVPDTVRAAYDAAHRYELEALAAEED